jgi:DNA-directed RNA polymerase specialized sigma24 family protein
MNDDEKHYQKSALNEAMSQIVEPNSSHAYSTIAIVERHIQRYGLSCEACDLLSEAYLRGLKAIEQGKWVQNWRAWIKGTVHNIARERFRKQGKEFPTDPQSTCLEQRSEPETTCDIAYDRNLAIFKQALEKLRIDDPMVAELMDWRILEELSWAEIHQRRIDQHKKPMNVEALRKQLSRAKPKLRRLFHQLGGEYEPLRRR